MIKDFICSQNDLGILSDEIPEALNSFNANEKYKVLF